MKQHEITKKDISELNTSLAAFAKNLPEKQQALLSAVVNFSQDGFASVISKPEFSKANPNKSLQDSAFKVSTPDKLDFKKIFDSAFNPDTRSPKPGPGIGNPAGPISDSIGVSWGGVTWTKDINKPVTLENIEILKDDRIKNILTQIRDIGTKPM